jgi:NAD(P)-dependent dehydrogenase (short-subunit alcohol dehydrogenase family)
MMTKDLENKTAIVTAASRGIGLAIAEKLVEQGAIVYMAVRDSEKNRQLTAQPARAKRKLPQRFL